MANTFGRFGSEHVAVMTREDLRLDANCFADEVTIDFPSVAPAVERIRRAFLADERPAALRAAVELTARQAVSGVTVPLDVPVQCTCGCCGGRGESWTEPCSDMPRIRIRAAAAPRARDDSGWSARRRAFSLYRHPSP